MRLIDADSLYRRVKTECNKYGAPTIDFESGNKVLDMIEQAPTVEPKQGEWIWKKDEDALRTYDLLCSECGYKTFTCENYDNVEQAKKVVDDRIREGKTLFPFCPNCGARMKGGDEK